MKRSLILVLTAAAAVATAVSGCGASSVAGSDAVAKAAAATTSTHGARVAMTMTMSSSALPRPVHMTANGVMNPVARKARIDADMSDLAAAAGGSGPKASQLRMTEILNGSVIYIHMPLLDGKLPGNKKWMKVDLAKTSKALGINFGQLTQSGQDPGQQVAYMRTVSDAKKVGTDTVRGVKTTHYRGVAKLDRYPQLLPPSRRAAAKAAVQRLIKLTGTSSMPIEAWIDGGNRIRRTKLTMNMKLPQVPQPMRVGIQEDLYAFGTPVNAVPPPSAQVYDATRATSRALRSSGLGG